MSYGGLFKVGDFAKLARVTMATLYYYDKVGLLSPVSRGDNNYRYYSGNQLAMVNVIRTLQDLGLTLAEIKRLMDLRTPELTEKLLAKQIERIDEKIDSWVRARNLLLTTNHSIESVRDIDEDSITIQYLPSENIILGEQNRYTNGRDDYDALFKFYRSAQERYLDVDLNYPVWGLFSEERVKSGDLKWPDRYYFYNPSGEDERPAGLYAVGYTRGGYGQSNGLYQRMADYIKAQGFTICGDSYEEYPLNELSVKDDTNYLIRVLTTVCELPKA